MFVITTDDTAVVDEHLNFNYVFKQCIRISRITCKAIKRFTYSPMSFPLITVQVVCVKSAVFK